jgi:hypothetical protein
MIALYKTAMSIQKFLNSCEWKFAFIGGIALQRWGEPRLTQDADITLFTGFGCESEYIDKMILKYPPRISHPKEFALKNRVLLLSSKNGIGIDVALGALPYEERLVERATEFLFLPDIQLLTCSAEDLVITKAFASRPLDWVDIKGIIIRQAKSLDWSIVFDELTPLVKVKEQPEILTKLDMMRTSGKNDI